ncbi:peptigoglycan-binding protein LysM [Streptomyces sp. SW4]|nr:peptigoglycan-binding protein LysM [Streptomyces sp. SW4]
MLSGNGRHRRPRQAPALVVAAGVTGSAIAIPLLGASGASAADGTTWDRVAECETGGAWSQNSGNGYYGGLQLTQENWERYGGLDYAPSADQASRSQQIRVAEKLLAAEGITAWPTCGLLAGLENDSPSAVGGGTADDGSAEPSAPPATPTSPTTDSSGTSDSSGPSGAETSRSPAPHPLLTPPRPRTPARPPPRPPLRHSRGRGERIGRVRHVRRKRCIGRRLRRPVGGPVPDEERRPGQLRAECRFFGADRHGPGRHRPAPRRERGRGLRGRPYGRVRRAARLARRRGRTGRRRRDVHRPLRRQPLGHRRLP